MPPENVEIVTDPPPGRVAADHDAVRAAEIVPELLMPPRKVEIVIVADCSAVPPTTMPWSAVIVPELLMPAPAAVNVPIVTASPAWA